MPFVHFRNVSFRYSSAAEILEGATFDLGPGWCGVVGANGMGKSTLLRLISGDLEPIEGSVVVSPNLPVALCSQEVGALDEAVRHLAEASDGASRRIAGELRLDALDLERWSTLSPGERKRWQIGAALASDPAVLLLDEPTNHIDVEARETLAAALASFRGVGLVVSHDRTFLNELTTRTIRIDNGAVDLWNGSYEVARGAWVAEERQITETYQRAKAEQRKLARRIADQRRAAETKRARHKRKVRNAGPKDRDARSMEKKGRAQAGETTAARRLETTQTAADRVEARLATFEMRRAVGREFFFDYEPARRSRLLSFDGDLAAGGRVLAPNISVHLEREDRVWLRGPNGAGKTTLLRALTRHHDLPPDRLFYLPQELAAPAAAGLLAALHAMPAGPKGRVLSLVAALGVDPDRLLISARPSPGEMRKLAMALGMGRSAWCLLLDEPTNHLDLPSIERLEEAVAGYPGAVLLITHDDEFAAATAPRTWVLDEGELAVEW